MHGTRRWIAAVAGAALLCACGSGGGDAARPTDTPSTIARRLAPDRRMQAAALRAIQGIGLPVDLVAIRASTGQLLAYVSHGPGLRAEDALVGKYPTGSTFKVVTAAALLEAGLTPNSPATCPASLTVGGKTLTNFDDRAHPIRDLRDAFAQSCNTAFAILGGSLTDAELQRAARGLGLGGPSDLGRPAFDGVAAHATSPFALATIATDGGATSVSPLVLATVAATVDGGVLHEPTTRARAIPSSTDRLDPRTIAGLQSMMLTAVTSGTASGQGLPAGTRAKTGTAEVDSAPPPRTVYAWLLGYRGDIAFAVLVVGGTEGGPVAGPIAARFLNAIT